ncbi:MULTISPECIES: hypothetical protein [Flavobacteriaceae]|uniref:hypothetical protein n=1 Tax=Flavobacteriaceae TaxID=49546 RepID=UPI00149315B8|nr:MULTISPECIES: hypothetical protein [Allomuricauda]MDC6364820.1 hypothetical protein [Muricauda sp. AC10]
MQHLAHLSDVAVLRGFLQIDENYIVGELHDLSSFLPEFQTIWYKIVRPLVWLGEQCAKKGT